MGAINCPLLEGSRTFPLPWNLRRSPRVIGWSVGLHRFGVSVMPATRLLGTKRSAHQKYTPAKNEQVRSVYTSIIGVTPVLNPRRRSTRGPLGLRTRTSSDAQVGADCGRSKSDPYVPDQPSARW